MRKLLSILLFISSVVNAQHITDDQYYIIPENSGNAWHVGEFNVSPADTALNGYLTYSFTILDGNSDGAFVLDSRSFKGQLFVDDSTQFYGEGYQEYTLTIEVSASDQRKDTAYANIRIHNEDSCIFTDPSWSGTESGTVEEPYNNWISDVGGSEDHGYAYFFKAGETATNYDRISFNVAGGSPTNQVFFAKYGSDTSIFTFSSPAGWNTSAVALGGTDTLNPVSYTNVYDIRGEYYDESTRPTFVIWRSSQHVKLNRCDGYHGGGDGEFYIEPNGTMWDEADPDIELRFCKASDNVGSHGFKLVATYTKAIGCYVNNAAFNNGFSLANNPGHVGVNKVVDMCYADGDMSNAFYVRSNCTIKYSASSSSLYQLDVEQVNPVDDPSDVHVHNCRFVNSGSGTTAPVSDAYNLLIEDCVFEGSSGSDIVFYSDNDSVVLRRNIFKNSGDDAIKIIDNNNSKIYLENNLIYDAAGDGIETDITDSYIRGNTIVDNTGYSVNNISGGSVVMLGTIYEDYNGTLDTTRVYDIDDGDVFTNRAGDDYTILDSAQVVVDRGYDFGQILDLNTNAVSTNPDSLTSKWDVGAYEFQWGSGLAPSASDNWDTLKINLTQTGYLASLGWNNMVTHDQYDSIRLTAVDDTLTNSYFVIIQDSLNTSSTLGNYPASNYTAPQNATEQNWWWGGLDSQVFKISNVPSGYYNLIIYGSKTGSSQDLDVEVSVGGKSVSYDAADNDQVYLITQINHVGGDFNIVLNHTTDGSHINFLVLEKTTQQKSGGSSVILNKIYLGEDYQGYIYFKGKWYQVNTN